ncbi:Coiled-coil domain-containing protein 92 [Trichoplax sp. H2]|nr:Coiled-coil domain-containing protein 92 [Trichoplax sp. H2]|eukprot:RDD41520.1 Coiled-coil domain-containing protein 92 [Trichoplax sp. H2]
MSHPTSKKLPSTTIHYLQEEHTKTLKSLHEEIEKLQKKCSDLTLELALKTNTENENRIRNQLKDLGGENDQLRSQNNQLSQDIANRDCMIEEFKNRLHQVEETHQETIKMKDDKLMQQCKELDLRKKLIAQLNTQLIQVSNQVVNYQPANRPIISPSPPASGAPRSSSGRMRTIRKTTSSPQFVMIDHHGNSRGDITANGIQRTPNSSSDHKSGPYNSGGLRKTNPKNSSRRLSGDYHDQNFIIYDDHSGDVRVNKTTVLPPISNDTNCSGRQSSPSKRSSIGSGSLNNNHKKTSIQNNDIGTVIVNPLAVNNATWDKTIQSPTNSKS